MGYLQIAGWDAERYRNELRRGRSIIPVCFLNVFLQVLTTISSRWCQTHTDYFAISTRSPDNGALLHVHNCSYVHAVPTPFTLRPKPHFIRDFDFLVLPGIPRIAAAIGQTVIIFPIGVDA